MAYNTAPYPSAGALPYPTGATAPVAATAPDAEEYRTKVELNISCKDLENRDVLSKSDPCCCVDLGFQSARGQEFREAGFDFLAMHFDLYVHVLCIIISTKLFTRFFLVKS